MKAPQEIDLKEDGIFTLQKKITSAEDLINNISVIATRRDGLLAVTRHYDNNWFLYVRKEVKK